MPNGSPDVAGRTLHREAIALSLFLTVLVIAHFVVKPNRLSGDRIGNVLVLQPWESSSYDDPFLKVEPSLIMLGASQQAMVTPTERNAMMVEGRGNTVLDVLARGLDERYPSTSPRTYLRLAGSDFAPLEQLASIGLWLTRSKARPAPVIIGLDVVVNARPPQVQEPLFNVLRAYPASTQELLDSLGQFPDGDDAVKRLSAWKNPQPWTLDTAELRFSTWIRSHRFYYGDPYGTDLHPLFRYQAAEEPFLRTLFGRLALPPAMPEQPRTKQYRFLTTLIRFLTARGMPVICYSEPRNPELYPSTPALEAALAVLQQTATDAGCSFVDAYHPLHKSENFGFIGQSPDEAHLSALGHRALGTLLLEETEKLRTWTSFSEKQGRTP